MPNESEYDDTDLTLADIERARSEGEPVRVYTTKRAWRGSPDGVAATRESLREGIYTVRELRRMLGLSSRRILYWVNEGMVGAPVFHGGRGYATLLSYEQVMRIRVLQRLRVDLQLSLQKARSNLEWILDHLVADEWQPLYFFPLPNRTVGVAVGKGSKPTLQIRTGQGVLDQMIPGLTSKLESFFKSIRKQWDEGVLELEGYKHILSDPAILAGSPVIKGTRIETAFIANLATGETFQGIARLYPHVKKAALREAGEFEGVVFDEAA